MRPNVADNEALVSNGHIHLLLYSVDAYKYPFAIIPLPPSAKIVLRTPYAGDIFHGGKTTRYDVCAAH